MRSLRRLPSWVHALVVVVIFSSVCQAEPPSVTAISPAGGRWGTEVSIGLQGKVDRAAVRLWSDKPGIELLGPGENETLKLKLAADAPRGTHWLRFHTQEGASGLRPFLVGDAAECLEVEPNDGLDQAQPLAELPTVVNGILGKGGDVDAYGVTLAAGQTLVAVLAAKQALGSPMDAILQVVDARGFVLEQNDDQSGFDPRVTYTAAKAGTYFVRTFGFSSTPGTSIAFAGDATYIYRLTITAGLFLDRTIPCVVTADTPAAVRAGGWNLPQPEVMVNLTALPAGVRPIFANGWESTAKVLATTLPVVIEQEPSSREQPQVVTLPLAASGVISEPMDVDVWKVTAKAGQRQAIRVTAVALGSALDAVVRIFDAAGQKLAEVDDAPQDDTDVLLEFSFPADGDYLITVTDRFAHGGPGYGYALTISDPEPTAVFQTAADAFVVKPDAALEIPITVERRSGFAAAMTISMADLPAGVTAEAVISEPEGDSSKQVKLMVKTSRAEGWSGPIRILGKVDGSATESVAKFPSLVTGEKLPHLWLTVLPPPSP